MMAVQSSTFVRPFCNAVTVIQSAVDEEQRESGLIIPLHVHEESGPPIHRGVVIEAGSCHCEDWEKITNGTVIFYTRGIRINDVLVVNHDDIIAFEECSTT